jgi:hypothetical protein
MWHNYKYTYEKAHDILFYVPSSFALLKIRKNSIMHNWHSYLIIICKSTTNKSPGILWSWRLLLTLECSWGLEVHVFHQSSVVCAVSFWCWTMGRSENEVGGWRPEVQPCLSRNHTIMLGCWGSSVRWHLEICPFLAIIIYMRSMLYSRPKMYLTSENVYATI